MIKKIILGLCILATGGAYAQQGTASPYSFYGVGDVKFKGTHEVRAMGSLAMYKDSLHINVLNPASYSDLQSTVLTIGVTNTSNYVNTDTNSASANRTSFDYFALAFPAGKLGVAFGLMPYSFVGYNIQNRITENGFDVSRTFTGDGGINRSFLGLSYKLSDRLSIGGEFAYNFGDTELSTQKFIFNDGSALAIDRGTNLHTKNNYSGITYNTAVNYKQPLYQNVSVNIGVTFSPETKLRNNQQATYSIFRVNPSGGVTTVDQRVTNNQNRDLIDPMKYSIGAGIGDPNKWFIGAEYTGTNSSKLNNYYLSENTVYKDGHKFAAGGFFTPDHTSRTSIFARTTYRAGLRYDYSGFELNGQNINDMAATVGFGMPIGTRVAGGYRSISNLNVTLEYGQRGTTVNGLINEKYFNVSIGLSFNDRWFVRRKYD